MHGEGQNSLRQMCRSCEFNSPHPRPLPLRGGELEGGLGVHGFGIVDHAGDALRLEF